MFPFIFNNKSINPIMPMVPAQPTVPNLAPAPAVASAQKPQPVSYTVPGRNVQFTDTDLNVLRPVLFGEVSNRGIDKKELEARVIANTAFNRMQQYSANGQQKTLSDVLSMPNQYQAYNGSQYHNYNNPNLDAPSAEKKQQIGQVVDKILAEIKAGTFKDDTNGSVYYKHGAGSTISYDDTRRLFKGNLGQRPIK